MTLYFSDEFYRGYNILTPDDPENKYWHVCDPDGKTVVTDGANAADCRRKIDRLVKISKLPKWLQRWIEDGDGMPCPKCRSYELKSQDGLTYCHHCGWQAKNPVNLHPERY